MKNLGFRAAAMLLGAVGWMRNFGEEDSDATRPESAANRRASERGAPKSRKTLNPGASDRNTTGGKSWPN